jgi:lipoxygenase
LVHFFINFCVQALKENKLFIVDYHDALLPYAQRINDLETSSIYATRTLFFLTSDGTLQVIAIELVLPPPTQGAAKNSRVFTPPPEDSTKNWVWELAKAHVLSNDSSYHQIFSHL